MIDLATEFFERLAGSSQPMLARTTTTIRVDLEDGKSVEHWFLDIQQGKVSATRRKAKAESVLHMDRDLFERIVSGRANAMASVLRGLITVEGDSLHLVAIQRIFPGPPRKPPPARIPSSAVRGPTSTVAQKPPTKVAKAAKTVAAARKTATHKTTTTLATATKAGRATSKAAAPKATRPKAVAAKASATKASATKASKTTSAPKATKARAKRSAP